MCNKVIAEIETQGCSPSKKLEKGKEESRIELLDPDVLAVFTIYTKLIISKISSFILWTKTSYSYRLLTRTTQPAHLAVIAAVLSLCVALYPNNTSQPQTGKTSNFYPFVYVATTAIHYGSQIWMTFISGLSLYFSLPRHDFGEVQKVLFPIYFTWSAILSLVAVTAQVRMDGFTLATALLAARFLLEVMVRARCCSPLIHLISSKNAIEASHGLGREVGKLSADSNLFGSEKYLSLHHQFRRLHMTIAMANMAAIGISTFHIWLSLKNSTINIC